MSGANLRAFEQVQSALFRDKFIVLIRLKKNNEKSVFYVLEQFTMIGFPFLVKSVLKVPVAMA
jgi:hypothetical protein